MKFENLKNITKKMIGIMGDVTYIKKNGYNSFHRYKYATEADVSSAFSSSMQKHGVFMFTSILESTSVKYETRGNKSAFLVNVKIEVTFVDADSGESYSCFFYGDGCDSDDKAIYKAITGAQKYALMKTFLAETGDDPERDSKPTDKYNNHVSVVVDLKSKKDELVGLLKESANKGKESFLSKWSSLNREQKDLVKDSMGVFKKICGGNNV